MKKQFVLWSLALAMLVCLFTGCNPGDEGGTVSGRVTLEGQTSHAETTVELYGNGSDEPIWSITASRSCIAFPYSPVAHFDWRMHQPLHSTTTDGAGNFSISDVPSGDYILCARQDSFGWSAPVSVSVQGGDVSVSEISLYREIMYGFGTITDDVTFEEGHHYVFTDVRVLEDGVTLTIEPGAVIRFAQDKTLIVEGTLLAQGTPEKWIVWTSNSDTLLSSHWIKIEFRATAPRPNFRYNRIEGTYEGLESFHAGGEFDHCFFRKAGASCLNLSGENIRVTNSIFYEVGGIGVTVNTAENPKIDHNLLYDIIIYGMEANAWDGGIIDNNWFVKSGIAGTDASIHILLCDDVHILHNEILDCKVGLHFGSKCDETNLIQANYFADVFTGIYIGLTNDNLGPSNPTIRYNCFTGDPGNFCLHVSFCQWNTEDIQAPNNYWNPQVTNPIWDFIDDPDNCPHVFITPELLSCPDSAGVEC